MHAQNELLRQAAQLDSEQKCAEAEALYERLLVSASASLPVLNNAANHYLICGQSPRAESLFHQILKIQPAHRNANSQLASLALERRDGPLALRYLDRTRLDDPGVRLLRAEALGYSGQTSEAIALLQALSKESNDPRLLFSVGLTSARLSLFDFAESAFNRVSAAQPGKFEVLLNLGRAAARAKHYERALRALEVAVRLRPDDPDALLELGLACAASGDYGKSVYLLAQARQRASKRPDVLLALARAAEDAGFYGDSLVAFDEYLAIRPQDDMARRDRARVCGLTGAKAQECSNELRKYVKRHPADPVGFYDLAQLTWTDQPEAAVDQLSAALRLDPGFAPAYLARGWLLHRLGRLTDAVVDLEAAVRLQPGNLKALNQLGMTWLGLGDPAAAERTFRRALQIAPDDTAALMQISRALMALDRTEEAQTFLERLKKLRPRQQRAPRTEPGMLELATLPRPEVARRQIERLRRESADHPGDPELQLSLAQLLLNEGQTEAANAAFRELLARTSDAGICYRAGTALSAGGQYGVAREFLQRAVEIPGAKLDLALATLFAEGPESALAVLRGVPENERTGDYYLIGARAFDALGRTREAESYLQDGIRRYPDRPEVVDYVFAALLRRQRPAEALTLIDRAIGKDGGNPDFLLKRAVVLGILERVPDAEQEMKRIELRWPEWYRAYVAHGLLLERSARKQEAREKLRIGAALASDDPVAACLLAHIGGEDRGREKCDCGPDLRGLLLPACE